MNQNLEREIAQLLQSWQVGTVGTDIFIGELPQGITEGLLIVSAPSPDPDVYIDSEYHIIDFWYISPHTVEAYQKCRDVYNLLHRRHHYNTTNWNIYLSKALAQVEDFDRTEEGGKMCRISVQFYCRNLNNVS